MSSSVLSFVSPHISPGTRDVRARWVDQQKGRAVAVLLSPDSGRSVDAFVQNPVSRRNRFTAVSTANILLWADLRGSDAVVLLPEIGGTTPDDETALSLLRAIAVYTNRYPDTAPHKVFITVNDEPSFRTLERALETVDFEKEEKLVTGCAGLRERAWARIQGAALGIFKNTLAFHAYLQAGLTASAADFAYKASTNDLLSLAGLLYGDIGDPNRSAKAFMALGDQLRPRAAAARAFLRAGSLFLDASLGHQASYALMKFCRSTSSEEALLGDPECQRLLDLSLHQNNDDLLCKTHFLLAHLKIKSGDLEGAIPSLITACDLAVLEKNYEAAFEIAQTMVEVQSRLAPNNREHYIGAFRWISVMEAAGVSFCRIQGRDIFMLHPELVRMQEAITRWRTVSEGWPVY